ncbi:hypothetical protein PHMEG_00012291 [Phytophthora megakarya]|uniref:Uncharacterized protein n=1 Tax=Phytophthora megakarya TaxID=4795 RepID=A0A225WB76_9STRA|nr:hypothetical protein PHMEG_00012291 [Phytophthora megakarya]
MNSTPTNETSVQNWYRAFSSVCEASQRLRPGNYLRNIYRNVSGLRTLSTAYVNVCFRRINKELSISMYLCFKGLMPRSDLKMSEMESQFYFKNGLHAEAAKKVNVEAKVLA